MDPRLIGPTFPLLPGITFPTGPTGINYFTFMIF
ncbi:exosporium leader peptide-containing protein [Bacillus thuringiensis]|nr:exosporium leader peptide-containing protein [Bacillus thuringiensis]